MPDVAIVTDSIANLPPEVIEQYRITIVPINICFRGEIYRDLLDVSTSEAYEMVLQDPDNFSTSPASPGHYLEAFREASKQAKNILCITLSSKLSTGYNIARLAMKQAGDVIGDIHIEVIDSLNVTASQGFIALEAARAAEEGKSFEEVLAIAEDMRSRVTFLALLDTIRYVYRTGRIPKIASQVASKLNIKPILSSASDGRIRFVGAVRKKESGINRILRMMREKVGHGEVHVAVMHAYAPDEAEKLKERVASEFNCVELWTVEMTPVMGYACGTGTVGIAFYH
ncbi:MAG TPA: DegV family protein [Dehalococcoidia bacterium]|nr:DegV family protein [Dehalococcoidia bacterium]